MIWGMPIRVTHIVDQHTPSDAISQLALLQTIPPERIEQRIMTVGPCPPSLNALCGRDENASSRWSYVSRYGEFLFGQSNQWRRLLAAHRPQVIHAWGTHAGTIARRVRPAGIPLVLTLTDPADIGDVRRWWPLQAEVGTTHQGTVVCASQFLLNHVVSFGVPHAAIPLIRPGIDLDERRSTPPRVRRSDLGLPDNARVLLTASPPTRAGGQFFAVWAAAILFQIWPDVRLLVPGRSREQNRIRRLIDGIYCPQIYHLLDDAFVPSDLLALADLFLAPAVNDVSTSWVTAAMAAGVPVVASTVPSLAEIIRDRHTGFTCRPGEPHTLAICVRQAIDNPELLRQCAAAARRWAASECDPGRCRQAHLTLYDHLAAPSDEPLAVDAHRR
jgi:glycosyltransferase involved in cell wall biosynthesis